MGLKSMMKRFGQLTGILDVERDLPNSMKRPSEEEQPGPDTRLEYRRWESIN
jgi:hypothetical protein